MNPVQGTNLSQLEAPQQQQNSSSGITVLPHELFDKIFKNLPLKNQRLMGGTCKTFRSISQEAFLEQKEQVVSFLKRILGTKFTPDIEKLLVASKNFKEFSNVLRFSEEGGRFHPLLIKAINELPALDDLSTIEFLDDALHEDSPLFDLSYDSCSKIPQETVDKLVSMLIKKHGIKRTLFLMGVRQSNPGTSLFRHSRELLLNAHSTLSPHLIKCATDRLKDDKQFMLAIIKQCVPSTKTLDTNVYWALEIASERLKEDQDVVLAAVEKDGHTLALASEKLHSNKNIVLAALKSRIRPDDLTPFIPPALRDDPEIRDWM
jgi:hypothetical protein